MSKIPTPEQISRLPKWAQEYIAQAERQAKDAQTELSQLKSGSLENAEAQKFYVERFDSDPYWLPQYGSLQFSQNPDPTDLRSDFRIRESDDPLGGIQVMGAARGRLAVFPQASNVIIITNIDY